MLATPLTIQFLRATIPKGGKSIAYPTIVLLNAVKTNVIHCECYILKGPTTMQETGKWEKPNKGNISVQ